MDNSIFSNMYAKASEEQKKLILELLSGTPEVKEEAKAKIETTIKETKEKEKEMKDNELNIEEVAAPTDKAGKLVTASKIAIGGLVVAGVGYAGYKAYCALRKTKAVVTETTETESTDTAAE